jgi:hypothetical protein
MPTNHEQPVKKASEPRPAKREPAKKSDDEDEPEEQYPATD